MLEYDKKTLSYNDPGPVLSRKEVSGLKIFLKGIMDTEEKQSFVISGAPCRGISEQDFREILEYAVCKGHRLVADDRVDIYAKDEMTLWGEPAEILRHLLEIRGVGIIDVMSLYGASAVKDSSQVQLAVYLENYDVNKTFDRLGNNGEEFEVSGVSIPRIRIPVKTGRNISVVIEAAAMNYRAKEMGFDATKTFEERLTNLISENEVSHD